MSECQQFPDTWEEFEQLYGFTDKEEVYTNGSRLMQSFRVKQWLDHIVEPERKKGKWIWTDGVRCSRCNYKLQTTGIPQYCPNCGSEMTRGE